MNATNTNTAVRATTTINFTHSYAPHKSLHITTSTFGISGIVQRLDKFDFPRHAYHWSCHWSPVGDIDIQPVVVIVVV